MSVRGITLIEDKRISSNSSEDSFRTNRSVFDTVCFGATKRTAIEIFICIVVALSLFVYTLTHLLNENTQSLVPYSSIGNCATASQLYNLNPQHINISYPIALKFYDYATGALDPQYTQIAQVSSTWSSCQKQAYDLSSITLQETEINYFEPLQVPVAAGATGDFNTSISSNDGCFQLSCGLSYTTIYGISNSSFANYLNNTLIMIIPLDVNDVVMHENGTLIFTNSQLMVTISMTDNSVTATCAVGIAGEVNFVLTASNFVVSSGTYLCTVYTTALQALGPALSITLSVIGVFRVYFMIKEFYGIH